MCGIFGIYNLVENKQFDKQRFENALLKMDYRGPDMKAMKEFNDQVILGHLRLAIIDLDKESSQPFTINNKYWMVFNGEIYNFIELREELKKAGHAFKTSGDTEVLLKSYEHWGDDCVNRFNGMWSFAIYNKETKKLFCSRDRFGIKPFNYTTIEGQFIFASEIKAILSYFPQLRTPDYNVIANFCRTSIGAQTKNSWFKDIFRLQPAHNLIIDEKGLNIYRYWDYPKKINRGITFSEAKEKYKELLSESLKLRMRSDVPIGFTLSSGLDSTSIVCLLKDKFENNRTYTAAFNSTEFQKRENKNFKNDVEIDEPAIVKKLTKALGLIPDIVEVDFKNYVADLQKIILNLESGHGSPAVFPLDKILEEAKKNVTVVLEGQGADELLGGYISSVLPVRIFELLKDARFKAALNELKAFSKDYSLKSAFLLAVRQSYFEFVKKIYYKVSGIDQLFCGRIKKYELIKDYPGEPFGFDNSLNKYLYKAHTGGLVNLLHYGDAVSMRHSLESRLPFMDYRLVEFSFTLPSAFKVHNGMGKYIHREAMKGIVPDYILNNKLKFGFDSPLSKIFSEDGENSATGVLLSERCLSRGLFSPSALKKLIKKQKSGDGNYSRLLYRMLNVELWFRNFIDNEA
jgi:asparagine synthase (glutamine-hydrolysing)